MHVKPFIEKFSQNEDFPMGGMVSVTLKNKSQGFAWSIGIMDGSDILLEGESMAFDAPAGAVFDETAVLQLRLITPDTQVAGDFAQIMVISNKVIDTLPLKINKRVQ
jgi:hypothetical protein